MMPLMKDTTFQNSEQLGRAIRLKRLEKGLSQKDLAARLGVERKWVIRLEAGNPKAELGSVLKALELLDIRPSLGNEDSPRGRDFRPEPSRLDEVFRRLQRSERK
jgi:HTH-type transcriptional regulator / antitoxin HipB